MNQEIIIHSKTINANLISGEYLWIIKRDIHATIIHAVEHDCKATIQFHVEAGGILYYHPVILGGTKNSLTISVYLQNSAQFIGSGVYALTGNQECRVTTLQEHQQPSSKSMLTINGIAAENASMHFHGNIIVQENAGKSNAMLENKTLLLGAKAKAISIPSLEIKNNDVQCAHGSAVGPLQEDQLIYAQSRGISYENAKRLLVTSFFAQTLSGMLDKNRQETIVARLVAQILGEK